MPFVVLYSAFLFIPGNDVLATDILKGGSGGNLLDGILLLGTCGSDHLVRELRNRQQASGFLIKSACLLTSVSEKDKIEKQFLKIQNSFRGEKGESK